MERIHFYLLLLSILAISCEKDVMIDCIPDNLDNSVMAFYSFSGGSLKDQSGNQRDLTNVNGVLFDEDRFGNPNCAVRFKNTLNQELFTDGRFTNNFHNKSFSISLWYNPDTAFENYELLIGRSDSDKFACPSKYGEWSIGLHDCRRAVASINKNSAWAQIDTVWSNENILGHLKCGIERENNTNIWKHVVFTFKDRRISIFINGILHNTKTGDGCGLNSENIGDVILGRNYSGFIDDVALFKKELNENEVLQLFNTEPCCN